MKLKRCNKRAHCTSLMGQLKLSDRIALIVPLKLSVIAAGAYVCAAWVVCVSICL